MRYGTGKIYIMYGNETATGIKNILVTSVADPGCFIPDPDLNISHPGSVSEHFSSRILHEK
jgi:hypothetical protein